jgi:hypothetical protein
MNTPANDWREEFRKIIADCDDGSGSYSPNWANIETFIETLLTKERSRIVERNKQELRRSWDKAIDNKEEVWDLGSALAAINIVNEK